MASFSPRDEAQRKQFKAFFESPIGKELARVRKAKWNRRFAARPQPANDPQSWVKPDPKFQKLVGSLIQKAAPAVANAINRRFVPVFVRAQRLWPRPTGLSLSLLTIEHELIGDGGFATKIRSAAPYTAFINKFETAQQLILLPGELAINQIAEDIAAELAE